MPAVKAVMKEFAFYFVSINVTRAALLTPLASAVGMDHIVQDTVAI
jgi:hypothetical protein